MPEFMDQLVFIKLALQGFNIFFFSIFAVAWLQFAIFNENFGNRKIYFAIRGREILFFLVLLLFAVGFWLSIGLMFDVGMLAGVLLLLGFWIGAWRMSMVFPRIAIGQGLNLRQSFH